MQNRKPKPENADNFFERIENAEVREMALAVRHVIKRTLPQVEECVKWELPFFSYHGNLCYINIRKDGRVVLAMYRGIHLSNKSGLLEGDGKLIKHVVLHPAEDLPLAGIQEILLEAAALNQAGPLKMKRT